jgi:hypothetical protein
MASVRLTELQAALLKSASKHATGSIFPLSDQLWDQIQAPTKTLTQLLKRGLISESACEDEAEAWRKIADQKYSLVITSSGRAAIGGKDMSAAMPADLEQPKIQPTCTGYTGSPPPLTKTKMVIDLLWREQGATICELVSSTGWLPHTTRSALTGLRKKGHVIAKSKRDDVTCYQIVETAA